MNLFPIFGLLSSPQFKHVPHDLVRIKCHYLNVKEMMP